MEGPLWEGPSVGSVLGINVRAKEKESHGTAVFLLGRWCHQLSLGVPGRKLVCCLGQGLGGSHEKGSGASNDDAGLGTS